MVVEMVAVGEEKVVEDGEEVEEEEEAEEAEEGEVGGAEEAEGNDLHHI